MPIRCMTCGRNEDEGWWTWSTTASRRGSGEIQPWWSRASKNMAVCEYATREGALQHARGQIVKVKWGRVNERSEEHLEVRCRLVAQELDNGK